MNYEDFSNHPQSVAEVRSERTADGRLWSPRDALVSLLRDIDSGKVSPQALIVVFSEVNDAGDSYTLFRNAAPDYHTSMGLLAAAQFKITED